MRYMRGFDKRSAARRLWCLLWLVGVVAGLYKLSMYSNTPAPVAAQPDVWPRDAKVALARDRPTILVTLHPRCTCSRATLEELKHLLSAVRVPLRVQILMYDPDLDSGAWAESKLAMQARSIPGVKLIRDPRGRESQRFGMSISGQTAVYAPGGRLVFSGGITRARGHVGDNAGRAAILAIVSDLQPETSRTPVFGCSIQDEMTGKV